MQKILILTLCVSLLSPFLFSCSSSLAEETKTQENTVETVVEEKTTADDYEYPKITDRLSWDKIDDFPIASDSMTLEEKRNLCLEFFRFTKEFAWTPDENYTYVITSSGKEVTLKKGEVYGSLPYVSVASGNIYRLMEFYDEETGVVDVSEAGANPALFGNQCSIGAFWAWGRVCNKADYDWTQNMTEANGFIRVGPYTYDSSISDFSKGVNTVKIAADNGENTMYESYAQLKPADGLVHYTTAGHVIMAQEIHVVRNDDGTINDEESYITFIDQTSAFFDAEQSDGSAMRIQGTVDAKKTFSKLFQESYLPFTLPELIGQDPVEKSEVSFSYEGGETISVSELKTSTVTSNYAISDVYVVFLDKDGEEVERKAARASRAGLKEMSLENAIFPASVNKFATEDYTIRVYCQISTGERIDLYSGGLTK